MGIFSSMWNLCRQQHENRYWEDYVNLKKVQKRFFFVCFITADEKENLTKQIHRPSSNWNEMAPKVSRDDILIPLADSRLSAVVEMERKQNQFSFHGILKKPTINSDFLPFYMFSSLPQYRSVFYFACSGIHSTYVSSPCFVFFLFLHFLLPPSKINPRFTTYLFVSHRESNWGTDHFSMWGRRQYHPNYGRVW